MFVFEHSELWGFYWSTMTPVKFSLWKNKMNMFLNEKKEQEEPRLYLPFFCYNTENRPEQLVCPCPMPLSSFNMRLMTKEALTQSVLFA